MNKPAIHYQSIRDGGEMMLRSIFLKKGIQPGIGGSNLCVPVLISKKRWPVRLRHRTQKNNTEKQRRNYFIEVSIGFRFLGHAVKIRISGFKSFMRGFCGLWRDEPGMRSDKAVAVKQQIIGIFILAVGNVYYGRLRIEKVTPSPFQETRLGRRILSKKSTFALTNSNLIF